MTAYPATAAKSTRSTLRNPHGWVLTYVAAESGPDWNTVVVEKHYRGEWAGELQLTRDEARDHYAAQRRAGFFATKDVI